MHYHHIRPEWGVWCGARITIAIVFAYDPHSPLQSLLLCGVVTVIRYAYPQNSLLGNIKPHYEYAVVLKSDDTDPY